MINENTMGTEPVLKHWQLPAFFWNSSVLAPGTPGNRERIGAQRGRERGAFWRARGKRPALAVLVLLTDPQQGGAGQPVGCAGTHGGKGQVFGSLNLFFSVFLIMTQ